MCVRSFLSLQLLLFSRADALFGYGLIHCQFTSSDDAVYLEQIYFNKELLLQYNGTLGIYKGYTKKAQEIADSLNKSPAFLKQEKKNEELCKSNIPMVFDLLSRSVEPSVRLSSVDATGNKHQGMLLCNVYGFYPKQIRVTWLRNGEEVTTDVTSTEELPNGDWFYQLHSYLEFTPTSGDKITCKVEHASLMEPKLYEWDKRVTDPTSNKKIAVGTAGLLLGLILTVAGLIYYNNTTAGRRLVPTSPSRVED